MTEIDMETWKGSSGNDYQLTYKQILLQQYNRCFINGSVEFQGGYWADKVAQTNSGTQVVRTWIANPREIYINSIRIFRIGMLPHILNDEEYKKKDEEIRRKIKICGKDSKSYDERIELYDEMFEMLTLLGHKLNFFEEEVYQDDTPI